MNQFLPKKHDLMKYNSFTSYLRIFSFLAIFGCLPFSSISAQEVAICGFNTDSPDGFAFVALRDYAVNEVVYFTDADYNPTNNNFDVTASDIIVQYTFPAGITKGTVIKVFNDTDPNNPMLASTGSVAKIGGALFGYNGGEPLQAFSATNPADPNGSISKIFCYVMSGSTSGADPNPGDDGDCPCSTDFVDLDFNANSAVDGGNYAGSRVNTTLAQFENTANWTTSSSNVTLDMTNFTNIQFGSSPAAPEIAIHHSPNPQPEIPNGSTTISSTIGTDYFTVCVGGNTSAHTYLVKNTGTADLHISGNAPTLSNTNDFNVLQYVPVNATIPPNGTETFIIEFDPATPGIKNCTVTVNSDDSDEDPYTFDIQGIGVSSPNPGDIIITEIMQNPDVMTDANGEWFEVYNTTGSPIDLFGCTISDDGTDSHEIGSSVVVPANGYAVLARNANSEANGGVTADYDYEDFTLRNGDDEVVLSCCGVEIDRVNYDGGPNFPDPTGASMSLNPAKFSETENNFGFNWCEATTPYGFGDLGTPGAANDAFYTYYADTDMDNHGDPDVSISNCSATPPSGYVTDNTDCDDNDGANFPNNAEICDGQDNNCDNIIDNVTTPCAGTTRTWNGSVDTDWDTPCNWTPACVPTAADDVVIPDVSGASGNDPVIGGTTAAACKSVNVLTDGKLTIINGGSLTIDGSIARGLRNDGTVDNAGTIDINNAGFHGLDNVTGTFHNSGNIDIDNTFGISHGLVNRAIFNNNTGGNIAIDETGGTGLYNLSGTFTNVASITIGANKKVGSYGLFNAATFNNHTGGNIAIEETAFTGLYNFSGTFTNAAGISIGANKKVGIHGLYNLATFNNNTGGNIAIEQTAGSGLYNQSGTFTNVASISIGANKKIGGFGLRNLAIFNNNTGGNIAIEETVSHGLYNDFGGTFTNVASITIGANKKVGSQGLRNLAIFNNNTGGNIAIEETAGSGLYNQFGTFTNVASISIGANKKVGLYGLYNFAIFNNNTGGNIAIEETVSNGLYNTGTFTNAATISIGANKKVGDIGLYNLAIFNNNTGGNIAIEETAGSGLWNRTGTFTNVASISIGANKKVGSQGLLNRATFNNNTGGNIAIEETASVGLYNLSGTFTNVASITIGANKKVGSYGLFNAATFNNHTGGNIAIEETAFTGLYNFSGTFTNAAGITIGANNKVGGDGLFNQATFNNNTGGNIAIEETASVGLYNLSGTFTNVASITIGANKQSGGDGLRNSSLFNNQSCADISLFDKLSNFLTFNNAGLFTVNTPLLHDNFGTVTNDGIIEYPQGNPVLGTVTNNEIIIQPTVFDGCDVISPAFGLGNPIDFTIHGVYIDAGANISAGTYVVATNTFTPTVPLAEGTYSYFVKIEDVVGGCTRIIPWQLTTQNCCEFTADCPANSDLGTFNCNTLGSIPALPVDQAGAAAPPYNITFGTNPCGTILVSASDDASPNVCGGTVQNITRTVFTWDDLPGFTPGVFDPGDEDSQTCTYTYTVNPDGAPTAVCPASIADVELDASGNGTLPANIGNGSSTDDCGTPTEASPEQLYTCADLGPQTVTLTATDACNNMHTAVCSFNVVDNIDPLITCPADVTKECDESTSSIWTGVATATDNCAMPPAITESDVSTQGAPGCPYYQYTITRTWTADDGNGNTKSCDQTITVDDTTGPAITCPANVTVECDADHSPANTGSATAVDNCDTQPVAIASSDATTPGNCPNGWTVTRTWTATDVCGNSTPCDQTITVEDTTPPVITCPADVTVECSDDHSSAANGVATATDNCSAVGDITIGESDATTPGSCANEWTITRTWTATDECGKSSSCNQKINVEDSTPPVPNCPADITVECDANTAPSATGIPLPTDNCSPNPVYTFGDAVAAGGCANASVITRTWQVEDECNNSITCDQTITVEDNTGPAMSCGTLTVTPNADGTYALSQTEIDGLGAGSSDNCGNVTFTAAPSSFDCADEGANTVTVTGTDECGNSNSCDATVTVDPYLTITSCTATDETCAGAGDGSIAIVATALGGQVKYSIDGGANFSAGGTFNNLTPGTYNIVVKVFGIAEICEKTDTKTVGAGGTAQVWYKDSDGDGYSDGNTVTSCTQPTGYIANPTSGTDCNDNDPAINPGATETCDGLDNDCDGIIPADETDADGDGYMVCENDCDDSDPDVNPGATEICNGIDDDCDGLVDEGVSGGLTWTGNVTFATQAEVDAWLACYSIIDGNLTIMGGGITDLSNLIGLEEVTGLVFIYANGSLTSLDGLDNLATVGNGLSIYYNFALADCCAIYDLLNNGGVTGSIMIFFNASGCNSQAEILSDCAPSSFGGENNNAIGWDLNSIQDISLFPNPATNSVNIAFERPVSKATLNVIDVLGRVVFEKELEEGSAGTQLNLEQRGLQNGLYFVSLLENGERRVKQLFIQR